MANTNMENREIEVRFLEIDKEKLIRKLQLLGAEDLGEDLLREIIFYDKDLEWIRDRKKIVRIRQTKRGIFLTYKDQSVETATGTVEIEFGIDDIQKAKAILEVLGLVAYREQEKKRRTFRLGEVLVDIDTWPKVPTYVELEGTEEQALKDAAQKLELDWADAVFENPRIVIEKKYGIPVSELHFFTFERVE